MILPKYGAAILDGKSLTVVGIPDAGGTPPRISGLWIRNLAAGQRAVVRGLEIGFLPPLSPIQGLAVNACAGPVMVEDASIRAVVSSGGTPGLAVAGSAAVTLTRCSVLGAPPTPTFTEILDGGPGIAAFQSSLHLYDCDVRGADGRDAGIFSPFSPPLPGTRGASGIHLEGGFLLLAGTSVSGGKGGDGLLDQTTCIPSGDGGDGIAAVQSTIVRFDSPIAGGAAGADPASCPPTGQAGADLALDQSTDSVLNEVLRGIEAESPAIEGHAVTTRVTGQPGEFALFLGSFTPDNGYVPALRGALIGAPPFLVVPLGTLPASGALEFSTAIPAGGLPAGVEAVDVFEQVLVAGATGFGLLSAPTVVTISAKGP